MRSRWVFIAVAIVAVGAGAGLWQLNRGMLPRVAPPQFSAEGLYGAVFRDVDGKPQSLSGFRGQFLVLNFWATWCAPCREEMPAFSRLQARWATRNVQFVGLTGDTPREVQRFLQQVPTGYPLLLAGEEADSWARRLGDQDGVLPYTVIVDPAGTVLMQKVGIYSERDLDHTLARLGTENTGK